MNEKLHKSLNEAGKDRIRLRRMTGYALLTCAGAVISILESGLPRPLPWMKPGLANVTSLLALIFWGFRSALTLAILRLILAGVLAGTMLSAPWALGLSGAICACCGMWLLMQLNGDFGAVSISVTGAICHNVAQAFAAALLLNHQGVITAQLPYMLFLGIPAGIFTGLLASRLIKHKSIRKFMN